MNSSLQERARHIEDGHLPRSVIGSGLGQQQAQRVSEMDREINRLVRAQESVREAVAVLADRLASVMTPQPESENKCGEATEGCNSQLGRAIQSQAFLAEASARHLRNIADALAV